MEWANNMKIFSFLSSLALVFFILSACVPAIDLSGAAGKDPDIIENITAEANEESTEREGATEGQEITTVSFYAPSFTISTSKSGVSTTGLSDAPIGQAEYQLSAPKILEIGEEGTIKLILVPSTIPIEKKEELKVFETDLLHVFQGQVDLYPYIKAEILAGNAFSISPSSPNFQEQLINTNNPTTWLWFITGNQEGNHLLAVNISVPTFIDGNPKSFPLDNLSFEIQITPLPPPPTAIPSPVPTATQTPSINEILIGSGSNITVALITSVSTISVALLTIFLGRQKNQKKNSIAQAEKRKKDFEEAAEKIKKNLPSKEKLNNTKKKN